MTLTNKLRKNIGTIVALLGFFLLCIMTFGDLGDVLGEEYWRSVVSNITSIGFMSVGLTCIQTVIKQGLAEQALQNGLNTENTTNKYLEHKNLIKSCTDKLPYLPYFLRAYNQKRTKLLKQDFLVNNNYCSEASLYASGSKRIKRKYNELAVHVTAASIKWSTMDIVYDKHGRIVTLDDYRQQRLTKSVIMSFVSMIGVTFLTGGLFFSPSGEPLWQKFVKLATYIVAIAIGSVFTVIKEYEKGAFGVPNDLDEINQIWEEFQAWEVPAWVIKDVEASNEIKEENEVEQNKAEQSSVDNGAIVQEEQEEIKTICYTRADCLVHVSTVDDGICVPDDEEQCGQCDGNLGLIGQEEIHRCGVTDELPVSN